MSKRINIENVGEYRLYLKSVLAEHVKNEKQRDVLVEELYLAFCDGISFGRGKLEVRIEE